MKKLFLTVVSILVVAAFALPAPSLDVNAGTFKSPPPASVPNDDFKNAAVIPGLPFNYHVDSSTATLERREPTPSCAQGYSFGKSVWYAYTPMNSGLVAAHVETWFSTALAVYTGSSLRRLTQIDSRCGGNWLTFRAEAGATYYLQIGGMYGDGGSLTLYLEGAPGNDDFANAFEVPGIPFDHYVDTWWASLETAEPTPSCAQGYSFDKSVWYAYTPSEAGSVVAHVGETSFSTALAVYTGSSLNQLTQMDSRCGEEGLAFRAEAGTTYYLQVGGIYGDGGSLTLYLEGPPGNDDFSNALEVPGIPFDHYVDTMTASLEAAEPTPSCAQDYSFDKSVWYIYTPAHAGSVTAHVDVWFSALAVYTGSSLNQLTQLNSRCWGEWLTFRAEAGTTYYLQVGGIYGEGGSMTLHLEGPPENDDFANAIQIPWIPFDHDMDTRTASLETGEPTPSCAQGDSFDRSVWYTYTPAEAGSLTARIDAWFTPALAVYAGDSLSSLSELGCRDWSGPLTFDAEAGTTYYFQIGGRWGDGDQLWFNLQVTPPPEADFGFDPYEPSVFDTVRFYNWSYDPAEVEFESALWDFGDGTTSTEWSADHPYAADGDYTVELTVTTKDGRSASTTRDVQVRTHDVAITKFTVPNAAKAGQTRSIVVGLNSRRYPEHVEVELFRSVPGEYDAYERVGSLMQEVPVRPSNRTTDFTFSYTFTGDDANVGKVTFKAEAHIWDARDAFPADNEAISLPTKVSP